MSLSYVVFIVLNEQTHKTIGKKKTLSKFRNLAIRILNKFSFILQNLKAKTHSLGGFGGNFRYGEETRGRGIFFTEKTMKNTTLVTNYFRMKIVKGLTA